MRQLWPRLQWTVGSGESNTGHGGGLQGTPLHTRALQDTGAGRTIVLVANSNSSVHLSVTLSDCLSHDYVCTFINNFDVELYAKNYYYNFENI